MTKEEARSRLQSLGLRDADAEALFAHFDDAEQRGKTGHGYARIPWLEQQQFDRRARPVKTQSLPGLDHWEGRGALGYLTLQAICDDRDRESAGGGTRRRCGRLLPDGRARVLGANARSEAGLVAVLTATSPPRLAHPDGGPPLTGTNPLAIAIPSSEGPRSSSTSRWAQ